MESDRDASHRAQRIWHQYQHMGRPDDLPFKSFQSVKNHSDLSGFCRICLEPDLLDCLVQPCNCRGTMQNVHLTCLDTWRRDARGNIIHSECDLCHEIYVDFQLHDGDLNNIWEMLRIFWAVLLFIVVTVGIPFLMIQGIDIDVLKESCSNLQEFYAGLVFPSLGRLGWNSTQLAMLIFALTVLGVITLIFHSSVPSILRQFANEFHGFPSHLPNFPDLHFTNLPNLPNLPHLPNLQNIHFPTLPRPNMGLPAFPQLFPLPSRHQAQNPPR